MVTPVTTLHRHEAEELAQSGGELDRLPLTRIDQPSKDAARKQTGVLCKEAKQNAVEEVSYLFRVVSPLAQSPSNFSEAPGRLLRDLRWRLLGTAGLRIVEEGAQSALWLRWLGSKVSEREAVDRFRITLLPQAPNCSGDVALESTHRLALALALRDLPIEIGAGLFRMMSLGEDDSVQDRVEPTIAASVEAMTNQASGRRFERCGAGVGRELCVGVEAVTGT